MASQQTVNEVLHDLVAVFGDPGMLEEKARLYHEAFKEGDDAILKQACRLYIRQARKFPFPLDLIEFCAPFTLP